MARWLDLGTQPKEWLEAEPDDDLVNQVADFMEHALCEDDAPEGEPVPHPLPLMTSLVPGTDVAVTWFEAHPFRCIKVLRIEKLEDAL